MNIFLFDHPCSFFHACFSIHNTAIHQTGHVMLNSNSCVKSSGLPVPRPPIIKSAYGFDILATDSRRAESVKKCGPVFTIVIDGLVLEDPLTQGAVPIKVVGDVNLLNARGYTRSVSSSSG